MKKHSKFFWGFGAVVAMTVLSLSFFWVGRAYATTGCFSDTNGSWAETAICWLKDNGITSGVTPTTFQPNGNVTRAQMAVFLQKQAEIPPTTGLITITPGNSSWMKFLSTDNLNFIYYSNRIVVTSPTATFNFVSMQPTIPSTFYGRSLQFLGVQLCYKTTAAAPITYVEINTPSSSNGLAVQNMRFSDSTTRTDTACRYYALPAPVTLTINDGVNIFVGVNFTAGGTIELSRATFYFLPTAVTGALPAMPTVILQDTTNAPSAPLPLGPTSGQP